MKMKRYVVLSVCLGLLLLPQIAISQPTLQGLEITGSAGGLIGDTFQERSFSGLRGEIDDGFIAQGRVAYFLIPHLGLELNVGGSTNDLFARVSGVKTEVDSSQFNFDLGPIAQYPINNIVPFASVGLGITVIDPDKVLTAANGTQIGKGGSATEFTINVGGGVKYFLSDRFGLRVDIRDHIIFMNDGDFWPAGTEDSLNSVEISGGAFYHF